MDRGATLRDPFCEVLAVKQLLHCMMQVQNLVTVLLTLGFLHLSISGRLAADQFLTIFSVVIAFYFGSQSQKNQSA